MRLRPGLGVGDAGTKLDAGPRLGIGSATARAVFPLCTAPGRRHEPRL